jgi:hypothetical protein
VCAAVALSCSHALICSPLPDLPFTSTVHTSCELQSLSSDDRSQDCNLSFLSVSIHGVGTLPTIQLRHRVSVNALTDLPTGRCSILLCFPALNVHLVFASARSPTHFDGPHLTGFYCLPPFRPIIAHKTAPFLFFRYLFTTRGLATVQLRH